jgi:hypothetical protein
MLRSAALLIVLTGLVGCASSSRPAGGQTASCPTGAATACTLAAEPAAYTESASALVFDPPVSRGMPPMDLSRDGRQPMAFGGFQQATTSFMYSRTADRQSTDFSDSYNRCTFVETVGTTVR